MSESFGVIEVNWTDLEQVVKEKSSWEIGPYRVQHEHGSGKVTVGTTSLDLKELEAFEDVLTRAIVSLRLHG